MADTTVVPIPVGVWTPVSTIAAKGFLTNEGTDGLLIRAAGSLPTVGTRDGHSIPAGRGEAFNFELSAGQVYARTLSTVVDGSVAVTEA